MTKLIINNRTDLNLTLTLTSLCVLLYNKTPIAKWSNAENQWGKRRRKLVVIKGKWTLFKMTRTVSLAFRFLISHLKKSMKVDLESLHELKCYLSALLLMRRSELCVKTLEKISRGGPLVKHLPMTSQQMHHYQTRGANKYVLPKCRTERLHRSFFPSTSLAFNNH